MLLLSTNFTISPRLDYKPQFQEALFTRGFTRVSRLTPPEVFLFLKKKFFNDAKRPNDWQKSIAECRMSHGLSAGIPKFRINMLLII